MSDMNDHPPVYLFTIDSLRADFFNEDLFPRCWDRFTGDFAWFSEAYANGIATPLAFPSILADDRVTGNGVINSDATTLAELLSAPTVALANNVHLSSERGYDRGFSQFDIDIDFSGYVKRALSLNCFRKNMLEHVRRRLPLVGTPVAPILYRPAERMIFDVKQSIRSVDPEFLWGHFMDPHGPYHPDLVFDRELGVSFSDGSFENIHQQWKNDAKIDDETLGSLIQIYEEKIKYLDHNLAELFEWLEATNRYDDALVIVTADHGQFIGEGGRFGHDWRNLPEDELLRVPLMVKFPDYSYAGDNFSHPVQHLDIHSTIAKHALPNDDVDVEGCPLTETDNRFIIAKSNSAIRGISPDGEILRNVEGSVEITGNPDQELVNRVKSCVHASVTNDVGQGEMTEEERQKVNERLEELGYR